MSEAFERARARLKEAAENGGPVEKAQFELFEYDTRPHTRRAEETHVHLLADTVRELLKHRFNAYSQGYADGYADHEKGNPPYVEPTTPEERPEYEYGVKWRLDQMDPEDPAFHYQENIPEALAREYAAQEDGTLIRRRKTEWEDA